MKTFTSDGKNAHVWKKGEWEQYKTVCDMIWGGYPLDITWARSTNLYREAENQLKQSS